MLCSAQLDFRVLFFCGKTALMRVLVNSEVEELQKKKKPRAKRHGAEKSCRACWSFGLSLQTTPLTSHINFCSRENSFDIFIEHFLLLYIQRQFNLYSVYT